MPGAVTRVPHSSTWHCHRAGQGQGSTARALPAPGICPDPPATHPAPGQWRSGGRSTGSRGAPGTDSIGLREQETGWGGKRQAEGSQQFLHQHLRVVKGHSNLGTFGTVPPSLVPQHTVTSSLRHSLAACILGIASLGAPVPCTPDALILGDKQPLQPEGCSTRGCNPRSQYSLNPCIPASLEPASCTSQLLHP